MDHPGASRRTRIAEPVAGLATELAEIPGGADVTGDVLLESVAEGILVSGTLSAPARLSCARCLVAFDGRAEAQVRELFVPRPGDDEYLLPESGELDPEPMVRDALLPALPFAPLCRPDCLGLCPRCGGNRNLDECACLEAEADPRWAALEGLAEKLERNER
jgi:uncharacterized protein